MTMGFYDLSKEARAMRVKGIHQAIARDLEKGETQAILRYFSDQDTYIRKAGYLAIGRIYTAREDLREPLIAQLWQLLQSENEKVRQTTINAVGEIGKYHFKAVTTFFDKGLFDPHHSVRNAVIGSMKKMSQKNPEPTLEWAKGYLGHPDKEIRREVCHGIELRGRTHPQDVLPLLEVLQHDTTARVKNTLVHVIGQISYKKGCLETVINALATWENQELVTRSIDEIVDVHHRYKNFSALTQRQAIQYIDEWYRKKPSGAD